MQIRQANSDDVETVVQILRSSRVEYLPYAKPAHSIDGNRRWVRDRLIPSGGVVIAELSGEDVGVLATSTSDEHAWIDQLYVKPGFIRQGIGSALLTHALQALPRPIRLFAFQENSRAIAFYQHYGFKAIRYTDGKTNEEQCPDVLFELV